MIWELLPIVVIAVLFWLLLIRPVQRRQRAAAAMQATLSVGQRVVTTSGFHATVHELGDGTVELELAPQVVVTVARAAVGGLLADDAATDHSPQATTGTPSEPASEPEPDSTRYPTGETPRDAVPAPGDDPKEG